MTQAGLTPMQAIVAGTGSAAQSWARGLGNAQRARADLIVLIATTQDIKTHERLTPHIAGTFH